jgi:hypothetical protein
LRLFAMADWGLDPRELKKSLGINFVVWADRGVLRRNKKAYPAG